MKTKPDCKCCKNEMCVNDECPVRGDYCPVPDIPGLCRYEERHEMTVRKAWENIAARLKVYSREHGFTDEDLAAEVLRIDDTDRFIEEWRRREKNEQ